MEIAVSDLPIRLRMKANIMNMGERIEWGSDTALMDEAADLIEAQAARIAAADALADAIDSDSPRVIGEALHAYRLTALKGQTHD